jgi:hypothetical protein
MPRPLAFTLVFAAALAAAAPALAQESNLATAADANPLAPVGWSFTPSLAYSGAWDDNVLIRGKGDDTPADFLNVVNPRGTLDYNGRHSQVSATYDGAFLLYRDLGSLNSYDQHGWLFARRMLTPHLGLFVRNTIADVPTTELSQFIAIPFIRTGSRLDDLNGGIEVAFTKRTSLAAGYTFQWVDFDHSQPGAEALRGGHSSGVSVNLKHVLSAQLTMVADYALQHAIVAEDGGIFDVQNTSLGLEYKFSPATRMFAAAGVSRLVSTEVAANRIGPALRLGLSHHLRRADVDVSYSRSFVPSYGFGGTMQNEETSGRVRVPLLRRVYLTSGLAWRRNDPLTDTDLPLRSLWLEGAVGYAATPWVHVEAFYGGTHQTIDRPGGVVDRNRFGFQVVTAKPVRIH